MTSLSKVTIKKDQGRYEWSQTDESIVVQIPIKNVLLKQINLFFGDFLLKVSATTIKFFSAIDLLHEIDPRSSKNRSQLIDDKLTVYLTKKQFGLKWETLEVLNLSKQEITQRRSDSEKRFYEQEENLIKGAKDTAYHMEKISVDEQMNVEKHQRKVIKDKKSEELKKAQDELFGDIDQVNQLDKQLLQKKKEKEKEDKKKDILQKIADDEQKEKEKKLRREQKGSGQQKDRKSDDIFDENDIQEISTKSSNSAVPSFTTYQSHEKIGQCTIEEIADEPEEAEIIQNDEQNETAAEPIITEKEEIPVPEVRQTQDVKMGFTEKKFAHLPARESQLKEAPYPKSKKIDKKSSDVFIDVEEKDPLWLKDKGDHFFKRNDFYAAINAYSKSIENDKDFLMSRMNRASTFLKMRQCQGAIDECNEILQRIQNLPKKELEEDHVYYQKMRARCALKIAAGYSWMSQYDIAIEQFKKAQTFKDVFNNDQIEAIQKDIEMTQVRKESQELKLQGDILFAKNQLDESLLAYHKAVEKDNHNEYALSNISVIHLKRQEHDKCLEFTERALKIIEWYHGDVKDFQVDNILEIKLLQRRAKCYEIQNKLEAAKADLDQALILDRDNPAVKSSLDKIQKKLSTINFEEYKEQGNQCLKEKKFFEAIELYEKCLRITRKATSLENISIYVNKIACLLGLQKYQAVISECNDAIRLVKNFKNKAENSDEDLKRLTQMDLRIAVRKANALQKLGKIVEAITENERALKIDPGNQQIVKDLAILRKM